MTITLFDLTYKLARLLGTISEGVATGGSITTIADSVERLEDNDYWNGGTAWILYDAAGAGAAPQGEYSYVSDYTVTGGVLTLRSTLTAAVAASDRYALATPRYPLQILIQKINESFGVMVKTDTTTITIASDQREYSLPTDLLELRQVYIQMNANSTNSLIVSVILLVVFVTVFRTVSGFPALSEHNSTVNVDVGVPRRRIHR